jgi:DNA-binding CsgD family transcriptional regulator
LDALQRARVQLLRAQIAFFTTRSSDVPRMLLDAAKMLAPLNVTLARETYLQAFDASMLAGPLGRGGGVLEVAEAAQDTPAPSTTPRMVDLLLDGLVARFTHGYEASIPSLRRALKIFRSHDSDAVDDSRRWLGLACRMAVALWDDETAYVLASRNVRLAREAGALATLPFALTVLAATLPPSGELARAAELDAEIAAITQATGAAPHPGLRLMLAAWRGRPAETAELYTASVHDATGRGEGTAITIADYMLAILHNGLGDYDAALAAAQRSCESGELVHSSLALPDLVEAAVRAGQPARADAALQRLSSQARASGTHWALGLEACARALTTTGPAAGDLYSEAIQRLGNCRMAAYLARTHLVYGEWLRREGRRQDAREQLRTAHELLSKMGMEAFAARAARELGATGEQPRKRTTHPTDTLTAHELHIARLVATGATSREVGTQLFLSPRTIDAHLRNIFRKLDITSRRQLRNLRLP